jgi:hypothetical protein
MWRRYWMRTREGESWKRGFVCRDVEGGGDIAGGTVEVGAAGEVEAGVDRSRKENEEENKEGEVTDRKEVIHYAKR